MISRYLFISFSFFQGLFLNAAQPLSEKQDFSKIGTVFLSAFMDKNRPEEIFIPLGRTAYFSFDWLNNDDPMLRYKIIYCNPDWTLADLSVPTYLEGFVENFFPPESKTYSDNTLLDYIHYQIQIPNRDIQLKISGHYILQVYDGPKEENLVVQRKFSFYEQQFPLILRVNQRHISDHLTDYLEVKINRLEQTIQANNISIAFLQNNDWNTYRLLKPQVNIRGDEVQFNFRLVDQYFKADAVYFTLDLSSWQTPTSQRLKITRTTGLWEYYLRPHEMLRLFNNSTIGNDSKNRLNGRFYLSQTQGNRAEYLQVFFTMNSLPVSDVYLYGAFTNWKIDARFKVKVAANFGGKGYNAAVLLKEGVYSYTLATQNAKEEIELLEYDNLIQTQQVYRALLFYRSDMENYDRLAALAIYQ